MTTARLNQSVVLHDMMENLFIVEELKDVYFNLGHDYDDENGNKTEHIKWLIRHYSKRERILAMECERQRPGTNWPFLDKHE